MAGKTAKPVRVCGVELRFADGTPVTAELFENEPTEAAMKRAEEISEAELDEEIRILDELRKHPERSKELSTKGGISYRKDD